MSFYPILKEYNQTYINNLLITTKDLDIVDILSKDMLSITDYIKLLSPRAKKHLEAMAVKAHQITKHNFGNTILLYTPMYISNHCINRCIYCGFNITNTSMKRKQLTYEEIYREASTISTMGMKHLLLLTGESPVDSPLSYLEESVSILKNHFNSIGIEIYPLDLHDYMKLIAKGVTGLTIYQETYDEFVYDNVHISGPKKDFRYRLDAPERGCKAGMREVNIGALLGLSNPILDAIYTGLHAKYLIDKYPSVDIGMSIPRIRPHGGELHDIHPVNDTTLVQIILANRLFLPRLGIALSTRETPSLRDNLLSLGITKMSAGVSTAVGGHSQDDETTEQFSISDNRSFLVIKELLLNKGYQPVHNDWLHF